MRAFGNNENVTAMKRLLLLALSVLTCGIMTAQDADRMMNTLIETIENKGISCDAEFEVTPGESRDIKLIMKGERWFMQTPETNVWYDGKTGWMGVVEDGKVIEVMMEEVSVEEQISNIPFLMIKYHEGFDVSASDSKTLVLTARDQKRGSYEGILKMTVSFGNDGNPTLIRMRQKDISSDIICRIRRFETGTTKDSDFTFPKEKWPDAEIIDMR